MICNSYDFVFHFFAVLCIAFSVVVFVMGLVTIFLIQILYPGSAFRYMLCKRGSLDGTCTFKYIPFRDIAQRCKTNGVEFTWEGLKEKLSLDDVQPLEFSNHTRVPGKKHYYLNVDRCAFGGSLKLSGGYESITNSKEVCGPMLFAVNQNCTAVYYYQDAPLEGWIKYKSVNYYSYLYKQLKCEPKEEFQRHNWTVVISGLKSCSQTRLGCGIGKLLLAKDLIVYSNKRNVVFPLYMYKYIYNMNDMKEAC